VSNGLGGHPQHVSTLFEALSLIPQDVETRGPHLHAALRQHIVVDIQQTAENRKTCTLVLNVFRLEVDQINT
jgi:hypothetical protein